MAMLPPWRSRLKGPDWGAKLNGEAAGLVGDEEGEVAVAAADDHLDGWEELFLADGLDVGGVVWPAVPLSAEDLEHDVGVVLDGAGSAELHALVGGVEAG